VPYFHEYLRDGVILTTIPAPAAVRRGIVARSRRIIKPCNRGTHHGSLQIAEAVADAPAAAAVAPAISLAATPALRRARCRPAQPGGGSLDLRDCRNRADA